jgi:hypothetical protein
VRHRGSVTLNVNNIFRDAAANIFEIVNDTGTMNATFTTSTFSYTNSRYEMVIGCVLLEERAELAYRLRSRPPRP